MIQQVPEDVVRHRFSFEDFVRLHDVGIFQEDDRIELIRGQILDMPPRVPREDWLITRMNRTLWQQVGDDFWVSVHNPVRLPGDSAPMPDVSFIVAGYDERELPAPPDVPAVIEVAGPSREFDRDVKLPLYAEAGIPEAWLFDVVEQRIERHTEPGAAGYHRVTVAGRGERLASTVIPAVVFDVDEVLGPEGGWTNDDSTT